LNLSHQTSKNSSITTDGDYIYLGLGFLPKGEVMKIGTGMNDTVAGKVYSKTPFGYEGDFAFIHCNKNLFIRKTNLPLGTLEILDP